MYTVDSARAQGASRASAPSPQRYRYNDKRIKARARKSRPVLGGEHVASATGKHEVEAELRLYVGRCVGGSAGGSIRAIKRVPDRVRSTSVA